MNAADKKLLELAAKAAEYQYSWSEKYDCLEVWTEGDTTKRFWQPHRDDGDALRLAAKLRLTVSWDRFDDSDYASATPPHTHQGYDCIADQDPCAATRRAIVRAAAEIGRAMP